MFAIVSVALVAGPATTALLWQEGPLTALLCAPLGASAGGLAAAMAIFAARYIADGQGRMRRGLARPTSSPVTHWR